jgi:hypothetical protein
MVASGRPFTIPASMVPRKEPTMMAPTWITHCGRRWPRTFVAAVNSTMLV